MWNPFAALIGGAAAGLTGLIFIVVAFRFDPIAVSQEYRNRAAQTLLLFLTVTVVSALVIVPQPSQALGTEMILAALISAVLLTFLGAAARRGQPTGPSAELLVGQSLFVIGLALSGLLVLLHRDWGLYFYAMSVVVGLVWGVYGAWIFLTRAGVKT
ncbi:hypothetical protein [Deinococcus sp.]|uniref:hypothetical protein n=1 Tax=Deinococcus sp. TaxID=47478 RepID=UPI003B5CEFDA